MRRRPRLRRLADLLRRIANRLYPPTYYTINVFINGETVTYVDCKEVAREIKEKI